MHLTIVARGGPVRRKTIRGGAAKLVGQAAGMLLRLGSFVCSPLHAGRDFGLVAMVTVVTGVFEIFVTGGLSAATVQRAEVTHNSTHYSGSTLHWGYCFAALCLSAAPLIAAFYRETRAGYVIAALAPAFVFNSLGVQHVALLQRQLRCVILSAIEVGSQVALGDNRYCIGACRLRLLGPGRQCNCCSSLRN